MEVELLQPVVDTAQSQHVVALGFDLDGVPVVEDLPRGPLVLNGDWLATTLGQQGHLPKSIGDCSCPLLQAAHSGSSWPQKSGPWGPKYLNSVCAAADVTAKAIAPKTTTVRRFHVVVVSMLVKRAFTCAFIVGSLSHCDTIAVLPSERDSLIGLVAANPPIVVIFRSID
jgi:hypothetical protein